jgi:hypothetical protein
MDELRPYRIEVDIANQLQKVWFLFTYNRFVPVLKEMTGTVVSPVEVRGVAGVAADA